MTDAILPCLRIIDFSDNPISTIEENFFHSLRESNLQELNFQNCQLSHIHPCELMFVSYSSLSFLADAFQYLYNLKHIDLFNNHKLLSEYYTVRRIECPFIL